MDCIARPYFICAQYTVNINSMCIPLSLVATIYSACLLRMTLLTVSLTVVFYRYQVIIAHVTVRRLVTRR